jgi:hypothetical protein
MSLFKVFGYEEGWGLPSPPDAQTIREIMDRLHGRFRKSVVVAP